MSPSALLVHQARSSRFRRQMALDVRPENIMEPNMSDTELLRSNFVSNLNGSYPADILMATLPAPLSISLTSLLVPLLLPKRYLQLKFASRIWIHIFIELCTLGLPLLLSFTLLSNLNVLLVSHLVVAIITLLVLARRKLRRRRAGDDDILSLPVSERKLPFLTNYRAGMLLSTCLCILAVDFPVFPRRFAKTETYGYSLMDVGVGTFIVAHGLSGITASSTKFDRMWKKSAPLLLLGFLRLVSVKMTGYHEHVTEYGTHWNFFFTLAFVKILSTFSLSTFRPGVAAFGLLVTQHVIYKLGLERWIIENTPRDNIIAANREGIFSLFGYMALYHAAVELGNFMRRPKHVFREWVHMVVVLSSLALAGWMTLPYVEAIFGTPSRRLANTSFCFWMLTFNVIQVATYSIVDLSLVWLEFCKARDSARDAASQVNIPVPKHLPVLREPYLMCSINDNGLVYFLLANVFTGLINFAFDTIHMGLIYSMIVLITYCAVLTVPVVTMYLWQIHV